jgi:DNA-binding transcriptional regulator of glucitol operon
VLIAAAMSGSQWKTYQHVLPDMQNEVTDILEYVLFTPPDGPEKEG